MSLLDDALIDNASQIANQVQQELELDEVDCKYNHVYLSYDVTLRLAPDKPTVCVKIPQNWFDDGKWDHIYAVIEARMRG